MNIREVPEQTARYGIDPYLDWLKGEGIPASRTSASTCSM